MKNIKLMLVMLMAIIAFNGANAQIHLPPHPPPPKLPFNLRGPGRPPAPPGPRFGRARSGRHTSYGHRKVVRRRTVVVHHR